MGNPTTYLNLAGSQTSYQITVDAGSGAVTYASDDETVAKVSSTGKVTPVKVGKANITITNSIGSATCLFVVFANSATKEAKFLEPSPATMSLDDGDYLQLKGAVLCNFDNPVVAYSWKKDGAAVANNSNFYLEKTGAHQATDAGTYVLSAAVTGITAALTNQTVVTIASPTPAVADSTLAVDHASVLANGKDTATLTLKLKKGAQPAFGQSVEIVATKKATTTISTFTETPAKSGIYVATIKATAADAFDVTVKVGGNAFNVAAVHVALTAPTDAIVADSTFTSDKTGNIQGDGTTTATLTLTLKSGSVPITGKTVTFAENPAAKSTTTISGVTETPANSGKYVATIKATAADAFDVSAKVGGAAFAVPVVHVAFVAHTTP